MESKLCSNLTNILLSICLFSVSFTTFMFCVVCNMDFGETYNLIFLTVNIVLMAVFFTSVVHYYYKNRTEKIYIKSIEIHKFK
jgi:hypothetical protein